MRKCHSRSLLALAFGLTLVVGFQNFSSIPLEQMKLARLAPHLDAAWARSEGQGDIRDIAPLRPASLDTPVLAAPETGTDLDSIGQDWARRQANLLTGGREQILLKEVNQRMHRAFRGMTANDPDAKDGPASAKPFNRAPSSVQSPELEEGTPDPFLKFTSLNRVQMVLPSESNLSCAVQGSGLQVDLSRTLGARVNLNLRHETSSNTNTLRLHYTW